MKKKNPADLTKRNNDARKKDIATLKERVSPVRPMAHMLTDLSERQRKYEAKTDERLRKIEGALVDILGDN